MSPSSAAPQSRPRTVVLVGVSSGIGRHAALRLGRQGHRLLLVGRDSRRGESVAAAVNARAGDPRRAVFIAGDVSTRAGIEAVVERVTALTDRVDTLLNNAGVMLPGRQVTAEGHEMHFAVHHLAPWTMTGLLLPLLERGDGRIVNTGSEGHHTTLTGMRVALDFDDLESERYSMFQAYSRSKLANLLFTYEFHRRYPRFTIAAVHPGMVSTRLIRGAGLRNPPLWLLYQAMRPTLLRPSQGGRPLAHLATAPDIANGRYYDRFTPRASSAASMNEADARRLWEITESLRGPLEPSPAPDGVGGGDMPGG
ncbi:SDR family NAD(P)-dependent oxidoreductase [Streptomonospora nanhaiensis]|uniref:SDR family NAD(P)-dependent oxidoreductase n=1 Tax=Streptomonospora nanhaiensis TaxID=1323731 RepID=UPI001C995C84|nr:SDR family NAD(P)-dependent oxidoreductase [Streptomonospora nanhaiensis]MBX9387413.1 SDR family NAD(P)-dependent oxidoreductase [Streptomonospora nanhaiensis]